MHKGAKEPPHLSSSGLGDDSFSVTSFKHVLFSFCLCFAKSSQKAKSQSFREKLKIYLRKHRICFGKLYVARSRSTHLSNILVLIERENQKMRNIVYPEVIPTNHLAFYGILALHVTKVISWRFRWVSFMTKHDEKWSHLFLKSTQRQFTPPEYKLCAVVYDTYVYMSIDLISCTWHLIIIQEQVSNS